jgi:hypothetical protein
MMAGLCDQGSNSVFVSQMVVEEERTLKPDCKRRWESL